MLEWQNQWKDNYNGPVALTGNHLCMVCWSVIDKSQYFPRLSEVIRNSRLGNDTLHKQPQGFHAGFEDAVIQYAEMRARWKPRGLPLDEAVQIASIAVLTLSLIHI